jgi:ribonuclease HII
MLEQLKNKLGFNTSEGLEDFKETIEKDYIGAQVSALSTSLSDQIEIHEKDINKIDNLMSELEETQKVMVDRKENYQRLLGVLY